MNSQVPVLYDETKIAELLHVSKRWLQTARQTGQGPSFVKVGRLVRYRPQDLEEWITNQIRKSTSHSLTV